jgi:hypothetical protein
MKYRIEVQLIMEDEVEADSPEEAFEIVSEYAIRGGDWMYDYEEIEDKE